MTGPGDVASVRSTDAIVDVLSRTSCYLVIRMIPGAVCSKESAARRRTALRC